jgi:putative ABC transport system permease protein
VNAPDVPQWTGVAASAALIAIAVAVTVRAGLGLAAEISLASVRAVAQLVAVAAVLAFLFTRGGLTGALGWMTVMVLIAGQVAARRGRGLPRARTVGTLAIGLGAAVPLITLVALRIIPTRPHVLVPVAGMIVAGAMQAAALTLVRVRDEAAAARPAIEARLCLGLPAAAAFAPHSRTALRTALQPAIDATKVVGLISLPGAMTGLILAGVEPLVAIRYQIVVMYMQLGAAAVAALTTARLSTGALFDEAHRLRPLDDPRTRT